MAATIATKQQMDAIMCPLLAAAPLPKALKLIIENKNKKILEMMYANALYQ